HRSLTHHDLLFLFFIPPRTPRSTLFPYTTLFRSTTFIVELPILEVKEEPQADRRGAHSSVPEMPRNILVVDDEEVIVELLNEVRSEEHTSELQSRFDLVCRLLLEKKKRTKSDIH